VKMWMRRTVTHMRFYLANNNRTRKRQQNNIAAAEMAAAYLMARLHSPLFYRHGSNDAAPPAPARIAGTWRRGRAHRAWRRLDMVGERDGSTQYGERLDR